MASLITTLPMSIERLEQYRRIPIKYTDGRNNMCDKHVKGGLVNILPNISKEMANETDVLKIEKWLLSADLYAKTLFAEFRVSVKNQLKAIHIIKTHSALSKKFDMNRLNNIPEDVVNHIYSYLMPETRLKLTKYIHPDISILLNTLTIPKLSRFLKYVINDRIRNIMQNRMISKYNIEQGFLRGDICTFYYSKIHSQIKKVTGKKTDLINRIKEVISFYETINPCPDNFIRQFLQKEALFLYYTIFMLTKKYKR